MIDLVYRKDENFYPKVFSEKYLIEDIDIFCSNSDEGYYDEECILEANQIGQFLMIEYPQSRVTVWLHFLYGDLALWLEADE